MGWLGWTITGVSILVGIVVTMSMMVVASRADDTMLGDRQYEAN